MNVGRFLDWVKSEKGKGITATSSFVNFAAPRRAPNPRKKYAFFPFTISPIEFTLFILFPKQSKEYDRIAAVMGSEIAEIRDNFAKYNGAI